MNQHDPQDMEHDAVWQLVDQARPPEAGPTFVSNVMREIRLAGDAPGPWWKRLLAPVPLTAGALAAAAAVAIMVSVNMGSAPDSPLTDAGADAALADLASDLDKELLITAAENPDLFSDAELLAMLY
ncbi:MAG: hypothetical protein HKO57_13630 [Akkermansiaceae bacterium]|nr:hypothetical protein [Akkermansiaceae bacterium]